MESVQECPKDGCNYSGNEHGLKTHLAASHEDSKYGRVSLSCDGCGANFSRAQWKVKSETVFCSRECKDNHKKEERKCTVCGTTKIVDSSAYEHKNGWVCSKECNKQQYLKEVECVVCGSTKVERHNNERKFSYKCSKECLDEWLTVNTTCDNCGKEYVGNRWEIERYENNYCSDDCHYDSQRVENSTTAQHKRWAKRVKESSNYTCEDCGESYDVMCAHHNPPRSELSLEEQVNLDNGICLCYPCHADRHSGSQRKALLGWWEWYTSDK